MRCPPFAAWRNLLGAVGLAMICAGCPTLRDPGARGPEDAEADVHETGSDAPSDAADDTPDATRDATADDALDAPTDAPTDAAEDAPTDAPTDVIADRGCPPGSLACGDTCVDPSDPAHCGACTVRCTVDERCEPGPGNTRRCVPSMCPAGFGDCDGDTTNACETPLATSNTHCGSCRRPCVPANGTGGCSAGRCVVTACSEGFADCDGDATNGCEVNTRSDPTHCGGCGTSCVLPNAVGACVAGVCTLTTCAPGFGDCNATVGDGCEVNLASTLAHCGACRRACAGSNATMACIEGTCRVAACTANYGDCDGDAATGCEVLLTTNVAHCGMCRRACASGQTCSSNNCACTSSRTFCEGVGCVALATNADHCGACNTLCPAVPNGSRACVSGRCMPQCNAGYTPSGSTCVPCGAVSQPACATGTVCAGGLTSCNGTCRDTRINNSHCGACGMACPSGQSCRDGLCCAAGQTNCDGVCRDLTSDDGNCGGCDMACIGLQRCLGGNCSPCGMTNGPCCTRSPICEMGTMCTGGMCR